MIEDINSWDRDLSTSDVFKLSPKDKQARTRLSFERKVSLLRRAVDEPVLLLTLDPKDFATRAAFRRWESAEHKFWRWSDPKVDDPDGPNGHLHDLWRTSRDTIKRIKSGKNSDLKKQLQAKEDTITALERQVCELMAEISLLHTKLAARDRTRR